MASSSVRRSWLYFAYGTNMNPIQIRSRCTAPEVICVAYLPNYKLGFYGHSKIWDSGRETCVPESGKRLWGVVYRLSSTSGDSLDAWQGVRFDGGGPYFHFPATVYDQCGQSYDVLLYKKDVLGAPVLPSLEFRDFLAEGAVLSRLPLDYIRQLKELPTRPASYPVPKQPGFAPSTLAVSDCSMCGSHG